MKAGMLHVFTHFVLATSLIFTAATAQGAELVVPSSLENVEGNESNIFPFGLGASYRYQQVYSASEFDPSEPVLVTEVRFRPDFLAGRSFSALLPDVQINISTTSTAPDGLSSTFADNVGPDDTVVFSGPLPLSSNATGAGPFDFDIVIPLSTPFFYDPQAGNLLLDIRNFGGGDGTPGFDIENTIGDSTSRVTTTHIAGDVNSSTAALNDSRGLVTQFELEPAAIAVLIDVKPGSDQNPVNPGSGGSLPVAVLTTDDFDAATIDLDQPIMLGDPDLAGTALPTNGSLQDVDNDGDLDLLLHFRIRELVDAGAIDNATQSLGLTGSTLDGTGIGGLDVVTIVPQ